MENLYGVIKSASSNLPDPNTYDKDEVTLEIEFNGIPYRITYHRQRIPVENPVKYAWGFDNGNLAD